LAGRGLFLASGKIISPSGNHFRRPKPFSASGEIVFGVRENYLSVRKRFPASWKIISPSGNIFRRPGKLFGRPETVFGVRERPHLPLKDMKNTLKTLNKTFLWPPPAGALLYDGSQNERSPKGSKKHS
jgi:hypothetical protein